MSCCGSKNQELRVVVIGTHSKEKENVIKIIKKYPASTPDCCETRVQVCCCPGKAMGSPVKIDGLDMVLYDTHTLGDNNHEGTDLAEVEEIKNNPEPASTPDCCETRIQVCCCPGIAMGSPVKIDGLDMVLYDTQTLGDRNHEGTDLAEVEKIKTCISKNARHVFLLVTKFNGLNDPDKNRLELLKTTFGNEITEHMVLILVGHKEKDKRVSFQKEFMSPPSDNKTSNDSDVYLKDLKAKCHNDVVFIYDNSDFNPVKRLKNLINDRIKDGNECYTYRMMMNAQLKSGENEKLPLPIKIGLLLGLWLGALLGVIFYGKDFLQTGVVVGGGVGGVAGKMLPAITKRIRDRI